MSKRKWADRRVPTKINPNYRRPLTLGYLGQTPSEPLQLGEPTPDLPPVFVEANGMRVYGVRKGDRRWVTGDLVQKSIDAEWFIIVEEEMTDAETTGT